MTQYYYIAAKAPLKFGTFGERPSNLSKDGRLFFDTELDASSLYIEEVEKEFAPKHLRLPYIAEISINIAGSLDATSNPNVFEKKCANILYEYVKDTMTRSYSVELYSALSGEEDLPIRKRREHVLSEITSPIQLLLADREYVKIVRDSVW